MFTMGCAHYSQLIIRLNRLLFLDNIQKTDGIHVVYKFFFFFFFFFFWGGGGGGRGGGGYFPVFLKIRQNIVVSKLWRP